ncbi:hypothetical protein DFH09DRAFT_1287705 [Mycena vulgaris]|nr:hypothetical protein DFH09DRAFT_1287705 [Mycena vulgaris]
MPRPHRRCAVDDDDAAAVSGRRARAQRRDVRVRMRMQSPPSIFRKADAARSVADSSNASSSSKAIVPGRQFPTENNNHTAQNRALAHVDNGRQRADEPEMDLYEKLSRTDLSGNRNRVDCGQARARDGRRRLRDGGRDVGDGGGEQATFESPTWFDLPRSASFPRSASISLILLTWLSHWDIEDYTNPKVARGKNRECDRRSTIFKIQGLINPSEKARSKFSFCLDNLESPRFGSLTKCIEKNVFGYYYTGGNTRILPARRPPPAAAPCTTPTPPSLPLPHPRSGALPAPLVLAAAPGSLLLIVPWAGNRRGGRSSGAAATCHAAATGSGCPRADAGTGQAGKRVLRGWRSAHVGRVERGRWGRRDGRHGW